MSDAESDEMGDPSTETYIALVQVGYQKTRGKSRPGQLLEAFHMFRDGGETKLEFGSNPDDGRWLTPAGSIRQHQMGWYMRRVSMAPGDQIRLEVKTGRQGIGQDEELTQVHLYVLTPSAPVREFEHRNIGYTKHPFLKGRLVEVAITTKSDESQREISELIDDETGM